MSDGRRNNGGKRKGAGSPGYGKLEFIKNKVNEHSDLWWSEWLEMMNSRPDEFINDNVKEILQDLIKKGAGYDAKEIIKDLAKGAFYRKQFAMSEFNKLQARMIPQDITSLGERLFPSPLLSGKSNAGNNSINKTTGANETD